MGWRLHACTRQGAVEHCANFAERQRAIHFFSVDEHRWCGVYAQSIAFVNRCFHRVIVLRLDAGVQFHHIYTVLLAGKQCRPIDSVKLRVLSLGRIYHVLVRVQIIRQLPVGVIVLRGETIRIHRSMNRPRMNFSKRIVLVDEQNAIAVLLEISGNRVWCMREQNGH